MRMQHGSESMRETRKHVAIIEKLHPSLTASDKGKYRDVLERSNFPVAAKVGHSHNASA